MSHFLAGREEATNCHISWLRCRSWRDGLTPSIHRETRRGTNCHITWGNTKGDKLSHCVAPLQLWSRRLDTKYSSRDAKWDKLSHFLAGHEGGQIVTFLGLLCSSWPHALNPTIHREARRATNCHMSWRDTKGDKLSHFLAPLQLSARRLDPEC